MTKLIIFLSVIIAIAYVCAIFFYNLWIHKQIRDAALREQDFEAVLAMLRQRKQTVMKHKVIFEAFVQTSYESYAHKYKVIEVEVPDDGHDWHVVGEEYRDE